MNNAHLPILFFRRLLAALRQLRLFALVSAVTASGLGQDKSPAENSSSLVGHWMYRSFLYRAAHDDNMNNLLFAEAELVFDKISSGKLAGALNMGETGSLTIDSTVTEGTPICDKVPRSWQNGRKPF